jgi:glyoxylase-like metal-dependent hydrolase (beta-lactamase superfamily II)
MRLWIVMLTLSCLLAAGGPAVSAQGKAPVTYEVFALRYAVYPNFPVASLVTGADKDRKIDLAMTVWLLKGSNGRNVLIDAGCYRDNLVKGNGLVDFLKPSDTLAKLNIKPDQITDVIISHMHWDHADGMDLFPKAKIWIQKDEYAYYTGAAWQTGGRHGGIDREDVLAIVRLNTDGKVELVDGDDREIIDGIRVYTGGRHTFASQYVGVRSDIGTMVIASDNMYLYENLEKHTPISQTFDADSNLKAQERMKQIASRPELVIPGHDPQVFVKYPKPGNGVARIQ